MRALTFVAMVSFLEVSLGNNMGRRVAIEPQRAGRGLILKISTDNLDLPSP